MLQNRNHFAIIMYDKNYDEDLIHIIQKMSMKRHIGFNRCKLDGDDKYSRLFSYSKFPDGHEEGEKLEMEYAYEQLWNK